MESTPSGTPSPQEQRISLYEKHKTIYVRAVKGWWATWRWVFVLMTQLVFFVTPWLMWHDRQAVLFHLVERKFYIFSLILWPQDVFYLALILIISAYSLFLFTAVAGRLFCGYACPQTVYTEIYLWIEHHLEGDHNARKKLDAAPWNGNKLMRKGAKHALWLLIALWAGFTLVGWFTPIHPLVNEVLGAHLNGWALFWVFFYACFFYMQAGFLREQVCKYMCPYARFQSVMFDHDTLIISYDPARGEPRGARRKSAEQAAAKKTGDCIDCGICVQVCPTGIDIRNGLQYECIGCGACIDACDTVMEKSGSPKGLIRYTSELALKMGVKHDSLIRHIFRPRVLLYSAVLWALILGFVWALYIRVPLRVDVIRDRSVMMREMPDGGIENVYNLRIMNMQEQPRQFTINVDGIKGATVSHKSTAVIPAMTNEEITVSVQAPMQKEVSVAPIYFTIADTATEKIQRHEKSSFLYPASEDSDESHESHKRHDEDRH